ncbi:hypothetical protein OKW34_000045 [Paraburkholderia youngii]|uniref:IS630 family transposase n=1 Tax=Paraburkholderia youngii TaxID=2782701 RepID=UPI003D1B069C
MGKMNLNEVRREELLSMQRRRPMVLGQARRARLILLLDEGASRGATMKEMRCDSRFITTWQSRFASERLSGLYDRHPGRGPRRGLACLEARVLNYTLRRKAADGSTHGSSRKLAAQLSAPDTTAQRIWRKRDIRPHRRDTHTVSNNPEFQAKAADVIGLYLNSPVRAAVLCVSEKTAIQALDGVDRMLPLSPGGVESHGFEYKRNGILRLFATLNVATGEVLSNPAPRHTSAQFVELLTEVASAQPARNEI